MATAVATGTTGGPPTTFRNARSESSASAPTDDATTITTSSAFDPTAIYEVADGLNKRRKHNFLVVSQLPAATNEIVLKLFVGIEEKNGAIISARPHGTATPTPATTSGIDYKALLQSTTLTSPDTRPTATLRFKQTGNTTTTTVDTSGLDAKQARESIMIGVLMNTKICLQQTPGKKVALSISNTDDTTATAQAIIDVLDTTEGRSIGSLDITGSSASRTDAILAALAQLSLKHSDAASMRTRVLQLFTTEAGTLTPQGKILAAELARHPEPTPNPVTSSRDVADPTSTLRGSAPPAVTPQANRTRRASSTDALSRTPSSSDDPRTPSSTSSLNGGSATPIMRTIMESLQPAGGASATNTATR